MTILERPFNFSGATPASMPIVLEEAFDVGTGVYCDFIKRYHGTILRRLDRFHAGMGIVGPANLTKDSRWSIVSLKNLSGKTIEIVKSLESLWLYGLRRGPSHPWRLVAEKAPDDNFSSLPGQHKSLYFDGKYPNDLLDIDVSRSALENAITVLDGYAKTLDENRKPNNPKQARKCFIILVLYFAEALRILPIRDLLQKGFQQYESPVNVDDENLQLARNWDTISNGFLSGSYSLVEVLGIDNEIKLKQKLWLIYNKEPTLHMLDGVRPDGWPGEPGNGGDAGAHEGGNGAGGHSGDGGPKRSDGNQGGSKNRVGGGQSRDRVAGRGSRLPRVRRRSIEYCNGDCGPGGGPISCTSGIGPVGHVAGASSNELICIGGDSIAIKVGNDSYFMLSRYLAEVLQFKESFCELEEFLKFVQCTLKPPKESSPGQRRAGAGLEVQMGVICYIHGRYADASSSFESIVSKLRVEGEMELACVQLFKFDETVELFEGSIMVLERECGPAYSDTLEVTAIYDDMGRVEDAVEILEYVLKVCEEKFDTVNPNTEDGKKWLLELVKEAGRSCHCATGTKIPLNICDKLS